MARGNGITRQEILACIKRNGAMTADSLAARMGISQVAVRQHLSSLEAEGYIAIQIERRGLGRPSHRFSLTRVGDETFPRNYDRTALQILDAVRESQGEAGVDALFQARRAQEFSEWQPRFVDKPLASKLHELAHIQTEAGFMAEVCEDKNTFLLIKRNCAVCSIARKYPAICCSGETQMFEALLGENVKVSHEQAIIDGQTSCKFSISAPSLE